LLKYRIIKLFSLRGNRRDAVQIPAWKIKLFSIPSVCSASKTCLTTHKGIYNTGIVMNLLTTSISKNRSLVVMNCFEGGRGEKIRLELNRHLVSSHGPGGWRWSRRLAGVLLAESADWILVTQPPNTLGNLVMDNKKWMFFIIGISFDAKNEH